MKGCHAHDGGGDVATRGRARGEGEWGGGG